MVFHLFGDIFAIWIFPILLTIVAYLPLLAYLLLCFGADKDAASAVFLFWGLLLIVWHVAFRIGNVTPHLRETPRALWGYMARFVRLILGIELFCVLGHFSLWWSAVLITGKSKGWGLMLAFGFFLLGEVLLHRGACRTFLYGDVPNASPQPVRGHDLGTSEDVAGRAWLDN